MVKYNKKSIYFNGTNKDFIVFLKSTMWMDITLEKLLKVISNKSS